MLSTTEQEYILTHAYVPEHLLDLMTRVSGGEPFLIQDCLYLLGRGWGIVVGYPLKREFSPDALAATVRSILERHQPREAWIIAPSLPGAMWQAGVERERDHYYTLELHGEVPAGRLRRLVERARQTLTVERSSKVTPSHQELMREFIPRVNPPPRVRQLLGALPQYVGASSTSLVLNARDEQGRLAAFYVVDLAAREFSTYVIGCYSRNPYVPWASDLLLDEMIKLSREHGKSYIHLGLGVNAGVTRFKKKWGGKPARTYEMCKLLWRRPSIFTCLADYLALKGSRGKCPFGD